MRKTKRLLSLLLAAAMVLSLVPLGAYGAEGDSFNVSFVDVDAATLATSGYLTATTVGTNWRIDTANSGPLMANGTSTAARWQQGATYAFLTIQSARGDLALNFTAPAAGTYNVTVNCQPFASGTLLDVYINDVYVGTVDGKDPAGSYAIVQQKELSGAALKAGDYANSLILRARNGNFYYQGITFTEAASPAALTGIDASVESAALQKGATAQIALSASLSNGGRYDIDKGAESISYESSSAAATVSDSGLITAAAAGEATITVTARIGGSDYTDTIPITVTAPTVSEVSAAAPRYILTSDADGEAITGVSARMSDGTDVDISSEEVSVTYTSLDTAVANVDANGVVTPVAEGTARIKVTVAYDGASAETTLEIAITAVALPDGTKFVIDYGTYDKTTAYDAGGRYHAKSNTAGENWIIDTANSTSSVYYAGTTSSPRLQQFITIAKRPAESGTDENAAFAVKFTAPETGIYDVSAFVGLNSGCGYGEVILIDGNEQTYLGTFDNYDANGNVLELTERELLGVPLTGGKEYSIAIRPCGKSGGTGDNLYVYNITFTPVHAARGTREVSASVETELGGSTIVKNATGQVTLSADITDNSFYNFSKSGTAAGITYESSDIAVATVSDTGVITGVGSGSADITVKADGIAGKFEKVLPVSVIVPEISEVSVTVPRYILVDDVDGEALTVTAKNTDGTDVDMTAADTKVEFTALNSYAAVSASGVVTPLSEGIAQIKVTVTTEADGKSAEKIVEIPITKDIIYPSFEVYFNEEYVWDKVSASGNFTADTVGTNWSIDKTATAATHFDGSGNAARIQKGIVEYVYLKNYGDFAVNFTVPESGWYDVTAKAMLYSGCGLAKFYINGKYVGEYDTYSSPGDIYTAIPKALRSVYLEAGENNKLIIRNGGRTGGGDSLFIRSFSFEGKAAADAVASVEVEIPRSTYAAGESDSYAVKVVQQNGASYYMPLISSDGSEETDFTVTSSDDSIVSVSDGTFKALLPNSRATLTAEGEINGQTVSGSATVNVSGATYDKPDVNLYEDVVYFTGSSKTLETTVILSDGSTTDARNVSNIRYELPAGTTAARIENGVFHALAEGEAAVTAYATFNGIEKSVTKTVKIENVKLSAITAKTEDPVVSALDADGSRIIVTGVKNNGETVALDGETTIFSYESLTPDVIYAENGYAHYVSRGVGTVRVTAKNETEGWEFSCDAEFISSSQKTEPTLYTNEMRAFALENAKKYDWAKNLVETAKENADKWVQNIDALYNAVPTEGIPRGYTIATLNAPDAAKEDGTPAMTYNCPACGSDLRKTTGAYSWIVDPITRPWKVQCPNCKQLFPSNDFESFYKLGITEDGTFSRELALENHRALFAEEYARTGSDYGYGYLKNELYDDKDSTWMVDDGFGWSPRDGVPGSSESVVTNPKWSTIAHYHHKLWDNNGTSTSILTRAVKDLYEAYLYTGDKKYGRAGVILLDRMADVYPAYDITKISLSYPHSHGGDYAGKTVGNIWETNVAETLIRAYDALYPMMEDAEVIRYLSEKAKTLKGVTNPKTGADYIRENIENGIVRESFKAAKEGKSFGNFGMHQLAVTLAAVALDVEEETNEMFDWLIAPAGEVTAKVYDPVYQNREFTSTVGVRGGEMLTRYMNEVDRDGFGNEVGVGYNMLWLTEGLEIAETIYRYGADSVLNLFENPKFVKMFNTFIKENVGNGYGLQIGDSGATGSKGKTGIADTTLRAFNMLGDPQLAKNYYWAVGGDLENTYISMFTDNSGLADRIREIVEEQGEYEFTSENLTGFGLAVLRGGELVKTAGAVADRDFRHDMWMYYGRTTGHGHRDMLSIGVDAYGFNFMPDLGYPEATGFNENTWQWVNATISHNTVTVNDDYQNAIYGGKPLHFDSTDKVQLIDVDAPNAYGATSIYRRTAVSVAASSEVAYTVDFFRVKGGNSHTYSFHTQSYMGYSTDDLTLVPQVDENGNYEDTYAGHNVTAVYKDPATGNIVGEKEVTYGGDPNGLNFSAAYTTTFPRGYTWLTNVNRAENIESGSFSVNFKQTDFNKQVEDSVGLNMKYTAVNDWTPTGIGIVTGYAPRTASNKNVPGLDYMLIHRTSDGELDTLFTSVLQPYKGEEYIADIAGVPVLLAGSEVTDNSAKAVRVTLKSGRADYIIYALDSEKTYSVSDTFKNSAGEDVPVSFDFRGFVGVYSVNDAGKNVYAYVNDGDLIGDISGTAKYTGEVISFTEELTDKNTITVSFNEEADLSRLAGEYVYIANTGNQNGSYKIISAETNAANSAYVDLNIGDVSLIKSFAQNSDPTAGYIYNIGKYQKLEVLLSTAYDEAPEITAESLDDLTVSAGSSISVDINASGEGALTFEGRVLPRGASVNAETGVVTWKPDKSQVGEAGFVIAAIDEDGRESTISFEVTVYGSTTGSTSGTSGGTGETSGDGNTTTTPDNSASGNTGTSSGTGTSGGGGGGGGSSGQGSTSGGGTAGGSDTGTDNNDNTDNSSSSNEGDTSGEDNTSTAPGGASSADTRFIDLGSHAWAADAINSLADDGIIRGTTATTYSPANNITRADYAILLVRAFGLESDDTTNFDDVLASDYFASELAIARNTGIVNGIGDNKYAPRNTITRQDMMVIIYRALEKLGKIDATSETNGDTTNLVGRGLAPAEYPDYDKVAEYARDAVDYLVSNGLVNGKNGRIAPTDYTTRAEVAVLLKRILDYVK